MRRRLAVISPANTGPASAPTMSWNDSTGRFAAVIISWVYLISSLLKSYCFADFFLLGSVSLVPSESLAASGFDGGQNRKNSTASGRA